MNVMLLRLLAVSLLVLNSVIAEEENKDSNLPVEPEAIESNVFKSPDGESYFPDGQESYYTVYYRAANLPSMLTKREPKGHVRFRIGILPSFTKPLFLTYSRSDAGATIEITRLSLIRKENSTEPGPVELAGKVIIGDFLAKNLEKQVIDPNIRLPLRQYTKEQRQLLQGMDGCTWIIEVSTVTDYTMEDIWSPEWMGNIDPKLKNELSLPDVDTKSFVEFCDMLLKLTDMKLPENGAPE